MTSVHCFLVLFLFACASAKSIESRVPHQSPDERIIGGNEATPHSAPYIAFLVTRDVKGDMIQCGGSLISENYILTAAHCLKDRIDGTIVLGAHNISQREDSQVPIHASAFFIHPYKDIGFIRLPTPVQTNENIKVVKLPTRAEATKTYDDQTATAFGWGMVHTNPVTMPSVLRTVDLQILPHSKCTESAEEICTSGEGKKGTCMGDSGGPLVIDGVLIGITSWGSKECEEGTPSVYVFVNKYLDWIQQTTGVVVN